MEISRTSLFSVLILGISIGCLINNGFNSYKKQTITNSNTTTMESKDLNNLGYGLTSNGQPCRITFNSSQENYGQLSDAVKYLEDFVIRQKNNESQEKEIECFFDIDTSEFELMYEKRQHYWWGIQTNLTFHVVNPATYIRYNTKYIVSFRGNVFDDSNWAVTAERSDVVHPDDVIKEFLAFLLALISVFVLFVTAILLCAPKRPARKYLIGQHYPFAFGDDSEQARRLEKDISLFEHALVCINQCNDTNFQEKKKLIEHWEQCELVLINDCSKCSHVLNLHCYHARHCIKESCQLEFCARRKQMITSETERRECEEDVDAQTTDDHCRASSQPNETLLCTEINANDITNKEQDAEYTMVNFNTEETVPLVEAEDAERNNSYEDIEG